MWHAVRTQGVEFGKAELQRVESEDVGHRLIELALLPAKQIAAGRGMQPVSQTYNRAVLRHEFNCTATFSDNEIWAPDARREAIVIGPGVAAPVEATMNAKALGLAGILVTQGHRDQLSDVSALPGGAQPAVSGAAFNVLTKTPESKDNTR